MLAANYTNVRNNLKDYCDMAYKNGETVVVTRKDDENIVIISFDKYNRMEKELKNIEYLAKIDAGIVQIESGNGVVHDIIEVDVDEQDME